MTEPRDTPLPLSAEEEAEIRGRVSRAHYPGRTWAVEDRARLLATLDAARAAVPAEEPRWLALSPPHLDFCAGGEFCTLDDCMCECHVAVPAEEPHLETVAIPDGMIVKNATVTRYARAVPAEGERPFETFVGSDGEISIRRKAHPVPDADTRERLRANDEALTAILYRIGCTVNVEQIAYYLTREGVLAAHPVPDADTRERLAALLADVFPETQRNRWPFTVEDVADRILASGVLSGDAEH